MLAWTRPHSLRAAERFHPRAGLVRLAMDGGLRGTDGATTIIRCSTTALAWTLERSLGFSPIEYTLTEDLASRRQIQEPRRSYHGPSRRAKVSRVCCLRSGASQ